MTREELLAGITEKFPSVTAEEGGEWLNVNVAAEEWPAVARVVHDDPAFLFDYMFCLTCVDWKTHLTMVYHLTSTKYRHTLVVKSKLDRAKPEIHTICNIWRTAEFHEREVYEMYGVNFIEHPDLRLLILPDGWEGKNPMRKDYEDPINMIKL